MQHSKTTIKDSWISLASPHPFAANDVPARGSPKHRACVKLLLCLQTKLVFACRSSHISYTELLSNHIHTVLGHRRLALMGMHASLIVHKSIGAIMAEPI